MTPSRLWLEMGDRIQRDPSDMEAWGALLRMGRIECHEGRFIVVPDPDDARAVSYSPRI